MCRIRTIVLASVLAGLLLLVALPASAGLAGWQYQREIVIQENSGETLRDYQVVVALDGSDFPREAQPDGDDIRFTDADGNELSYWIEEFNAGSRQAKIWVKVPEIPANGKTGITMWYGNSGAGSVSDGEAVFEFFDDFEDGILSKWSIVSGSWSVSNGILRCVDYPDNDWHYLLSKYRHHADVIVESKIRKDEKSDGGYGILFALKMEVSDQMAYADQIAGDVDNRDKLGFLGHYKGHGVYNHFGSDFSSQVDRWYNYKLIYKGDKKEIFVYDENSNLLASYTSTYDNMFDATDCGVAILRTKISIDNYRVRAYTSLEPTITLAPPSSAIYTTIFISKSPTLPSIRQFGETTITISIENTGTTDVTDIEVTDAIHPSLDLVSGDFPNPKRYDLIRPGETRDLQYTISAKESGTFMLDLATVTYADEDGNIQKASSEPASIKVIPSTEDSTSGSMLHSNSSESEGASTPGFVAVVVAGIILFAIYLRRKRA